MCVLVLVLVFVLIFDRATAAVIGAALFRAATAFRRWQVHRGLATVLELDDGHTGLGASAALGKGVHQRARAPVAPLHLAHGRDLALGALPVLGASAYLASARAVGRVALGIAGALCNTAPLARPPRRAHAGGRRAKGGPLHNIRPQEKAK